MKPVSGVKKVEDSWSGALEPQLEKSTCCNEDPAQTQTQKNNKKQTKKKTVPRRLGNAYSCALYLHFFIYFLQLNEAGLIISTYLNEQAEAEPG